MSREQDLLFCKIAISTGKVTQDVAQKCLALANRFESEGKKRPQVGAIFLKQNLLSGEDVQKIYGAVQKRLEVHGGAPAATAVHGRPAAPAPARAPARGPAHPPARPARVRDQRTYAPAAAQGRSVKPVKHREVETKIDPTTLWLGVSMLVVVLIAVGVILYVLLSGRSAEKPVVQGGIPGRPEAAAPSTPGAPAAQPAAQPAKPAVDYKKQIEDMLGKKAAPPAPAPSADAPPADAPPPAEAPAEKAGVE